MKAIENGAPDGLSAMFKVAVILWRINYFYFHVSKFIHSRHFVFISLNRNSRLGGTQSMHRTMDKTESLTLALGTSWPLIHLITNSRPVRIALAYTGSTGVWTQNVVLYIIFPAWDHNQWDSLGHHKAFRGTRNWPLWNYVHLNWVHNLQAKITLIRQPDCRDSSVGLACFACRRPEFNSYHCMIPRGHQEQQPQYEPEVTP